MSAGRISSERLERLAAELSDRDRQVVELLATLHLASGRQLLRVLWPEASESAARAARRELARLTRQRVVARLERRVGGLGRGSDAYTYALDVGGQRLLGSSGARRPRLPRPAMWDHVLAGAEAYTCLHEGLRGSSVRLVTWQGDPACWRRYPGLYAQPQVVKPDAYVQLAGDGYPAGDGYLDSVFLEIDTGSQSSSVIRTKCEAYRLLRASGTVQMSEDGVFPRVVFLCLSTARQQFLVDVLSRLDPDIWQLFAVGQVKDVVRVLAPEVLA